MPIKKEPTINEVVKILNKINKKLDDHDKRFDDHDKRFDDHDKRFSKNELAILKLQEDVQEIKDTMSTKDDINKIMNTLDYMIKLFFGDHQTEHTMNIAAHDRFETRITKLEEKVFKL